MNPVTINVTFASLKNTAGPGNTAAGYKEGDKLAFASDGNWVVEANYKFPSLFSAEGKGGSVALRANHSGSIRTYDLLGFNDFRYKTGVPPFNFSAATAIETGAYTLFGMTADYWVTNNLSVYVDVQNIFNKQDVWIYAAPLVGRHSTLGVKVNL